MSNELTRPIDPDTAKAVEETAKLGGKLVDAGTKAGGYVDRVIGRLPDNLVGLAIGDWVLHKRVRRWAELQAETSEILRKRGVTAPFEDISPSIAVPLIEAAVNETRDGLKEVWARLLADAIDPKRRRVRLSFIDAVKRMDPLDAIILQKTSEWATDVDDQYRERLIAELKISSDEIEISFEQLVDLRCVVKLGGVSSHGGLPNIRLTPFGRELMRAVRD